MGDDTSIRDLHRRRTANSWRARLQRTLTPPDPYILNPDELRIDAPLGQWNLYIGGAGTKPDGYVNLDLFPLPGVDVAADAEHLPFRDGLFQRIECDAVLEHVERPESILREMSRTLKPGGFLHVVVPFAHPFHEYPRDYRRFTIDALKLMNPDLEVVKSGWRTGPTATLLVFVLEYAKLWVPNGFRPLVHGILGWVLFPLRYLDLALFKNERTRRIGNHCYLWLRKPASGPLLK